MEDRFLVDSNTLIYASKERAGQIARWLELARPAIFYSDVSHFECLERWEAPASSERELQRTYLTLLFYEARIEERLMYTGWQSPGNAYAARAEELMREGIKERDSYIAAAAEFHKLVLVTADVARNFAPRLEKLAAEGKGAFRVPAYDFTEREAVFTRWNAEAGK